LASAVMSPNFQTTRTIHVFEK